jgi:hypothetical protein
LKKLRVFVRRSKIRKDMSVMRAQLYSYFYREAELERQFEKVQSLVEQSLGAADIDREMVLLDQAMGDLDKIRQDLPKVLRRTSIVVAGKTTLWALPLTLTVSVLMSSFGVNILGIPNPWVLPWAFFIIGILATWAWVRGGTVLKRSLRMGLVGLALLIVAVAGWISMPYLAELLKILPLPAVSTNLLVVLANLAFITTAYLALMNYYWRYRRRRRLRRHRVSRERIAT